MRKLIIAFCAVLVLALLWLTISGYIQLKRNAYGLSELQLFDQHIGLTKKFDDGPYVFIEGDTLVTKRIIAGEVEVQKKKAATEKVQFIPGAATFSEVPVIAAVSDIHGQYDLFEELLQAHHIINNRRQWTFGEGHLVIVGDVFDRGPKVTEALWLIYTLEEQATRAGGKVHFLLGNHEFMVLQNDLAFIHTKYKKTARLLGVPYSGLYGQNTLLGRWLRSRPSIVKINNTLFVHGGISPRIASHSLSVQETNRLYQKAIDLTQKETKSDPVLADLMSSRGLPWYRAFFKKKEYGKQLDNILQQFEADHLVVGHTTQPAITAFFKNRLYAIDAGMKKGKSGELLLIQNGKYYRGNLKGEQLIQRN